jgi:hypothetical protein
MNNPPAFPKTPFIEVGTPQNGMTLRDYFAAKAMQAIIAGNITGKKCEDRSWLEADQWAPNVSYEIADAMLMAREA